MTKFLLAFLAGLVLLFAFGGTPASADSYPPTSPETTVTLPPSTTVVDTTTTTIPLPPLADSGPQQSLMIAAIGSVALMAGLGVRRAARR